MQVSVLGPLVVEESGTPVALGGARLRALLVRLAAEGGRWVGAGALADALWADDPPADQANALQSLVSRLRRALPDPGLIDSGPAGYRLAVEAEDVDAFRFEADLSRARRPSTAGLNGSQGSHGSDHTGPDGAAIRAALALWRGPALVDVPDLPFAVAWAARLEELRLGAVEDAVEAALTGGLDLQAADVVLELEGVVAAHPLRERPHGQLIRVLVATGRQAEALNVYEQLRTRLADELGVDPGPDLKALHLALVRGEELPGAVVPARSRLRPQRRSRTNLRPSLTSFVGREDDVRGVREMLRRSRLVTLTGPGGTGKTRLSVEAAAKLEGVGAEGVWQVQLAPVTDPADLAMTALAAIGLREAAMVDNRVPPAHRDPLNRLVEAIDDQDVVLLLDNCEHVIEAAAELAETLLGRCPRLAIIATSREPLGILGESLWPVKPLPISTEGTLPPALHLFADRAALVRPGFVLDASNRATVTEICRRLDGLPLAIELAAARLRTLPLDAIAQRLSDRFRLLTGGNRTALPRHQTLRAVVAWSWGLLTDAERSLAERLSIFPGGATATSAGSLPGVGPAAPELLDALADKSLLVVVDGSGRQDAETRYRMLETIREFGAERLAEQGEIHSARASFSSYFVALVERAEPMLRCAEQIYWLGRLDEEHDNILAALRYATDAGDSATAIRLAAGMAWYWTLMGQHEEAAGWLAPVMELPGREPAEAYLVARMIYLLSTAGMTGTLPAQDDVAEVAALVATLDRVSGHPLLTLVEPAIAMLSDDGAEVRAAAERNSVHADPWARAMLKQFVAISAENDGDLDTVRAVLPEAVARFRRIGDRWGLSTALGTQANLYGLDGDDAAAIAALDEARNLMGELRARDDESYVQVRAALLRARGGDLAGARAELDLAHDLAQEGGAVHSGAFVEIAYGQLARMCGDLAEARRRTEAALVLLERAPLGPPQINALAHIALIGIDVLEGDLDSALTRLPAVLKAFDDSHDMPIGGGVADVMARLAAALGDPQLAARLIGAGIRLRGGADLGDPETLELVEQLVRQLGEAGYAETRASGEALTRAEARELLGTLSP